MSRNATIAALRAFFADSQWEWDDGSRFDAQRHLDRLEAEIERQQREIGRLRLEVTRARRAERRSKRLRDLPRSPSTREAPEARARNLGQQERRS